MTFGIDDQNPQALTRRELRERERANGIAGASAAVVPSTPSIPPAGQVVSAAPAATPAAFPQFPGTTPTAVVASLGGSIYVPPAPAASSYAFPAPGDAHPRTAPGTPVGTRQSSSKAPKRTVRTIGSRLLSLGALVLVGAFVVAGSLPANAFYDPSTQLLSSDVATPKDLQSIEVASNVQSGSTTRDKWSVLSWADVLKERYGTRDFTYTVGMGPIRWPFPAPVPISSGFGERVAPCRGCSSHHMGVDFTPGNGAPIFVIADGVVIEHKDDRWGFGNHVIIEHHINGHVVTTTYAHMQHGSSPLKIGEEVKVGDFIGLVGMTGTATGAHLHLEITVDGVKVDPFQFLKTNAS